MKRTLSFMVMALALLLTQCRKPEVKFPTPSSSEGVTVSMTVTAGPGSKTDITDAGVITWSKGDKLYVGDGENYIGFLILVGEGGSATGTFTGNVTLTDISEDTPLTFHFFYLGSTPPEVSIGANSATVSFASQNIYADVNNKADDNKKLVNASAQHVGYGSANGTVTNGAVTGINVTLVSKVALARFSFTAGTSPYEGELTLSGDHIYNSMTVGFGGTFTGEKTDGGNISLGAGHAERYVMLVPAGTGSKTLNFVGGATGSTTLANGIEANKFYGKSDAIAVSLHEYVDLGLSVKWAKCNLGAEHPYDYGNYYAWGETAGYNEAMVGAGANCGASYSPGTMKTDYSWAYYKWGRGEKSLGKYVNKTGYGMNPYDGLTTLLPEDDAARAVWGGDWRMPTADEFQELIDNTTWTWYGEDDTDFNGVAGWKCANKLDATKYIFLPAAGWRNNTSIWSAGSEGSYWSRALSLYAPSYGSSLVYDDSEYWVNDENRVVGRPVRPVCEPQN